MPKENPIAGRINGMAGKYMSFLFNVEVLP
jgi:hypothetical protein